jgi:hypothetical protein
VFITRFFYFATIALLAGFSAISRAYNKYNSFTGNWELANPGDELT